MKEFRSTVKVDVDVLGSPSLTVRAVSVDVNNVKEEVTRNEELNKNDNWPEISIITEETD